ncbi:hypothetical protein BKA66DRAFT_572358 [Pyrenochaeta sp. MPI-SDFR-AT-0127]|nr:hypothetical protein BKA66DRAFT_572358 [Pyrenochaeta sp. MPI-SDFR-AT-0127]
MLFAKLWPVVLAGSAISSHEGRNSQNDIAPFVARFCGTATPQVARSATQPRAQRRALATTTNIALTDNSTALIPVDTYWHIISADGTEEGGNISDERIKAQTEYLNKAFRPVGFQFRIVETTRTINEHWYYNLKIETPVEREVAAALRRGGNATLNIYMMGGTNTINPAWATIPHEYPWRGAIDGVYQNGTHFVGGSNPEFNLGGTLVHEVGHWFGLYHNFGPDCERSYDYVDDTPIEDLHPDLGTCPTDLDSCPDQPGKDLTNNWMSLFNDGCRNSFTPGQIQRMRMQMVKYRGYTFPGIRPEDVPEDDTF